MDEASVLVMGRAVLVAFMLSIGSPASGQQATTSRSQADVLQQLLTEVRELRASVERAASESAGLQLIAVRAAMQEERLYRVSRDVDTLRGELEVARREARTMATSFKEVERAIADETDSGRRQSLESELPTMRRMLQAATEKEQLLAQQEGAMSGSLATEEGRWQDINASLDDLERRLASRARQP